MICLFVPYSSQFLPSSLFLFVSLAYWCEAMHPIKIMIEHWRREYTVLSVYTADFCHSCFFFKLHSQICTLFCILPWNMISLLQMEFYLSGFDIKLNLFYWTLLKPDVCILQKFLHKLDLLFTFVWLQPACIFSQASSNYLPFLSH